MLSEQELFHLSDPELTELRENSCMDPWCDWATKRLEAGATTGASSHDFVNKVWTLAEKEDGTQDEGLVSASAVFEFHQRKAE